MAQQEGRHGHGRTPALANRKQPKPIAAAAPHPKAEDREPVLPSSNYLTRRLARLNINHRVGASQKHPPSVESQLQAKALAVSALFDSSILKSHSEHRKLVPGPEKDRKTKRAECKPKKPSKDPEKKQLWEDAAVMQKDLARSYDGLDVRKLSTIHTDRDPKGPLAEDDGGGRVPVSLATRGGRRRSFCGSQVELADFLASNGVKVVSVDMPPFMQIHAVSCARKTYDSLEKFTSKALAFTLKKEFDGVYGPAWHCIVGRSFGSFVTHSVGGFLYFSMDHKLYILLFKTTVQRAD